MPPGGKEGNYGSCLEANLPLYRPQTNLEYFTRQRNISEGCIGQNGMSNSRSVTGRMITCMNNICVSALYLTLNPSARLGGNKYRFYKSLVCLS